MWSRPAALTGRLQERVARANAAVARALLTNDAAALSAYFQPDALSMPEYQPTLAGRDVIHQYYQALLRRRTITAYARTTTELLRADHRIIETGVFAMTYRDAGESLQRVRGKYVNVWVLETHGGLSLHAESYGYFRPLANPAGFVVPGLPRAAARPVQAVEPRPSNLQFQLRALNALMEQSVQQRDGNLRADFFTADAIFMPFADTLKVGMPALRPYLIQYNSYPVTIDSICIGNQGAEEAGPFVIEYPIFRVQWHTTSSHGQSSGKGIRIWRREADHSLKIYREIGVHDQLE